MKKRIGVILGGPTEARRLCARSQQALDLPLASAGSPDSPNALDAELSVSVARDEALVLGAFQRVDAAAVALARAEGRKFLRRGSGGPTVVVAPGTVHVSLSLPHPGALTPADEARIVNRMVRPLLRALTTLGSGAIAHFFGRDWISMGHRPVGWVGFAHDATTRRTLFEAFVGLRTPFAAVAGPSHAGKAPWTLEAALVRALEPGAVATAVVEAYRRAYDADLVTLEAPRASDAAPDASGGPDPASAEAEALPDPPWSASADEAIGSIGAGADARGVFRVGGDLLVSRDALARLEARAADAAPADIGRLVDETLGAPGVALDGVRFLGSVRDVIVRARAFRAVDATPAGLTGSADPPSRKS